MLMTYFKRLPALTLLLSIYVGSPDRCAAQPPAAEKLPIAIVNMDRLTKTYKPLQEKLAVIRQSAEEADKTVQLRNIELETVGSQLRKVPPGSAEALKIQQQFIKLQSELRQFIEQERQEILKREVALHLELHRRVGDEINAYAKANGIKLVLRQQDSSLEENQPIAEIQKSLGRNILYQDGLDITDDILKALTEKDAKP